MFCIGLPDTDVVGFLVELLGSSGTATQAQCFWLQTMIPF